MEIKVTQLCDEAYGEFEAWIQNNRSKPPSSSKEPPYHLLNHKDNEDFSLSNGPLFIDPKKEFSTRLEIGEYFSKVKSGEIDPYKEWKEIREDSVGLGSGL